MKKFKIYHKNKIGVIPLRMKYFLIFILSLSSVGCQKEFLSKSPTKSLIVPTTLNDFQSLLDNSTNVINLSPGLNEICTDDFYTTDVGLQRIGSNASYEQNIYLFAKSPYDGSTIQDWDIPYQQVFYTNVVLDGLGKLVSDVSSATQFKNIKGSALFIRAFAFYNLAQEFSKPYTVTGANTDLGIPIRLSPDVTIKSVRPTLQETYDQIINDLTLAATLLPDQAPLKTRPIKAAALALLARVYLNIGNYAKAENYASLCLSKSSKLIDYNTLNASASKPLPMALPNGNDEVIYYNSLIGTFYEISSLKSVDSTLYRSYDSNDLRKVMFYRNRGNGIYTFKGSYDGDLYLFGGLATDEIFLIRAECYARQGKTIAAMGDLNTLMKNRWSNKVTYPSFTAANANDALSQILRERRKELTARGLRWSDLRRLNLESQFAVKVTHQYNGQAYTLSPNSNLYVFPIPDDEIAKSGIEQNIR